MRVQSVAQKTILLCLGIATLILCFQNCSFAPYLSSHQNTQQNEHITIEILDTKTLSVTVDEDISKFSMSELKLNGIYSYPTISKNTMHDVFLQYLNHHYSCSDTPKRCEITFKIPDQIPEMDLSKIYSYRPKLSLVVTNTQRTIEKSFQVYIDHGMLRDPASTETH